MESDLPAKVLSTNKLCPGRAGKYRPSEIPTTSSFSSDVIKLLYTNFKWQSSKSKMSCLPYYRILSLFIKKNSKTKHNTVEWNLYDNPTFV